MTNLKLTEESKIPFDGGNTENYLTQKVKGLLNPLLNMMEENPWTSRLVLGFLSYVGVDALTDKMVGEKNNIVTDTMGFGVNLLAAVMIPEKIMDWVNDEKTAPQQQRTI